MADGDAGGNGGAGNAESDFRTNPMTGHRQHRHKGYPRGGGPPKWHDVEQKHGSDAHTQFLHQSAGLGRDGMGGDPATVASNMAAGGKQAPMKNKNKDIGDIKSPLDVFSEKHNIPAEKVEGWKKFMSAGGKLALGTAANVLPGLASKGMSAIRRLTQSLFSADPMSAPSAILGESSMLAMSTAQDISDGIDRTYNILPDADKDAISGTIKGRRYLKEKEEADRASSDVMDWMDGRLGKGVDINDLDTDSLDSFSRDLEKMTNDTLNGIAAKQMNGEPITEADRTKLGMYQAMLSNVSERGKGLEREHKANAANIRSQETHDRRMERQQSAAELQQKYDNSAGTERVIRKLLGDGGKRDVKIEQDGLVGRNKINHLRGLALDSADGLRTELEDTSLSPQDRQTKEQELKDTEGLIAGLDEKKKRVDDVTRTFNDTSRPAWERIGAKNGRIEDLYNESGFLVSSTRIRSNIGLVTQMINRREQDQAPDYYNAKLNGATDKDIDGYEGLPPDSDRGKIWQQREDLRQDPLYIGDTNLKNNYEASSVLLDEQNRLNTAIRSGRIPPEEQDAARQEMSALMALLDENKSTFDGIAGGYHTSDTYAPLYDGISKFNEKYKITGMGNPRAQAGAGGSGRGRDARTDDQKRNDAMSSLGGNVDQYNPGNISIRDTLMDAGTVPQTGGAIEKLTDHQRSAYINAEQSRFSDIAHDAVDNNKPFAPEDIGFVNFYMANAYRSAAEEMRRKSGKGGMYDLDYAKALERKADALTWLNADKNTQPADMRDIQAVMKNGVSALMNAGTAASETDTRSPDIRLKDTLASFGSKADPKNANNIYMAETFNKYNIAPKEGGDISDLTKSERVAYYDRAKKDAMDTFARYKKGEQLSTQDKVFLNSYLQNGLLLAGFYIDPKTKGGASNQYNTNLYQKKLKEVGDAVPWMNADDSIQLGDEKQMEALINGGVNKFVNGYDFDGKEFAPSQAQGTGPGKGKKKKADDPSKKETPKTPAQASTIEQTLSRKGKDSENVQTGGRNDAVGKGNSPKIEIKETLGESKGQTESANGGNPEVKVEQTLRPAGDDGKLVQVGGDPDKAKNKINATAVPLIPDDDKKGNVGTIEEENTPNVPENAENAGAKDEIPENKDNAGADAANATGGTPQDVNKGPENVDESENTSSEEQTKGETAQKGNKYKFFAGTQYREAEDSIEKRAAEQNGYSQTSKKDHENDVDPETNMPRDSTIVGDTLEERLSALDRSVFEPKDPRSAADYLAKVGGIEIDPEGQLTSGQKNALKGMIKEYESGTIDKSMNFLKELHKDDANFTEPDRTAGSLRSTILADIFSGELTDEQGDEALSHLNGLTNAVNIRKSLDTVKARRGRSASVEIQTKNINNKVKAAGADTGKKSLANDNDTVDEDKALPNSEFMRTLTDEGRKDQLSQQIFDPEDKSGRSTIAFLADMAGAEYDPNEEIPDDVVEKAKGELKDLRVGAIENSVKLLKGIFVEAGGDGYDFVAPTRRTGNIEDALRKALESDGISDENKKKIYSELNVLSNVDNFTKIIENSKYRGELQTRSKKKDVETADVEGLYDKYIADNYRKNEDGSPKLDEDGEMLLEDNDVNKGLAWIYNTDDRVAKNMKRGVIETYYRKLPETVGDALNILKEMPELPEEEAEVLGKKLVERAAQAESVKNILKDDIRTKEDEGDVKEVKRLKDEKRTVMNERTILINAANALYDKYTNSFKDHTKTGNSGVDFNRGKTKEEIAKEKAENKKKEEQAKLSREAEQQRTEDRYRMTPEQQEQAKSDARNGSIAAAETKRVTTDWKDRFDNKGASAKIMFRRDDDTKKLSSVINETPLNDLIGTMPEVISFIKLNSTGRGDPSTGKVQRGTSDAYKELAKKGLQMRMILSRIMAGKGSDEAIKDPALRKKLDQYTPDQLHDLREKAEDISRQGYFDWISHS